ncbi:UDP-N-acetylmuramoyl-L-alanyl-D-glutamate--2,6-diaminopimelate ligase [Bacillaceae bacterium S4-13-58]
MNIHELISILPFYQSYGTIPDIQIEGIEMDSRKVNSNFLFVCIEGFHVDGHQFAPHAVERGACAIISQKPLDIQSVPVIVVNDTVKSLAMIADKFYQSPTRSLRLIGITGTNGKTSISYMVEKMFQNIGEITGLIGTIQMRIAEKEYDVRNTTPDSLFLQESFHKMEKSGVSTAVMEVSSHALDLGRVFGCDFDIAVFTNLTQDHLDYHQTMEEYFRAKSMLFSQLGNTYDKDPKFAIINLDDSYGEKLLRCTVQPVITYGLEATADIVAKDIVYEPTGTTFTIRTPIGEEEISTPLVGKFNVYNILAATGVGLAAGISLPVMKKTFEQLSGVRGRFESVLTGQSFGVIIDYAHTPASLENVLETAKEMTNGKIHVVIGCGGDRDRTKRPKMAQVAIKYGDIAIFTSDNPRSEDPQDIVNDMISGINGDNYIVELDRKKAIEKAILAAKPDDLVLIAGKGHETYQEINGNVYPFDDRAIALQVLRDL